MQIRAPSHIPYLVMASGLAEGMMYCLNRGFPACSHEHCLKKRFWL